MKLNRLFRKAAAFTAAACMTLGGLSQIALADYASQGDMLESWVCQVVVQNGTNDQNSNLWMNDGVFEAISYKTEQHVTLDPADGAFANAEDVLNFAAIYFSYYGEFSGDAQFDITLTNVTIHSTGYDPIALADYSSVEAGTNNPVSSNDYAVRYDFQDQLDASVRTDVLRNLEYIEFDLYVDSANFSDAPQVGEASAAPGDEYTELAAAGGDANIDAMFFAMDQNWSWIEPGSTVRFKYQTEEHAVIEIDGTAFADAVGPMNTAGFQIGYYTDQFSSEAKYSIQYTISNVVLNFDGYDPIAVGDFSSADAELSDAAGNSGKLFVDMGVFPADADTVEMFRHLTSVEFDYRVDYLGVTGAEGRETEPEESSEESSEEPSEETTQEPEESTEESTQDSAETSTEESEAAETTADNASTQAAEEEENSGNNMVKLIVTVVAVVILLAALVVVGVMYVKKSRQI